MPSLDLYPNDPQRLEDLARDETTERAAMIERHLRYYNGQHKKPLKVRKGQTDDNVIINVTRKMIDQAVSMLFGQMPTFQLQEGTTTPQEQRLSEIWEANTAAVFLHNLATSGGLAGHCFVKVLPVEGDAPRFVMLDPARVTVYWSSDDKDTVLAYKIQWGDSERQTRQDIVAVNGGWLIVDMTKDRSAQWQITGQETWPYAWCPVLDWQNMPDPNDYYGMPDLITPEQNDSINFVASNVMRILKFHAHPKTIGTGLRKGDIEATEVDGFWAVPNAEAKIANLEMQSDLTSSMTFLNYLHEQFFSGHRAVDLGTLKDRVGQLTNFGLRSLFKDALDKLETKRSLYGDALVELSARAFELDGQGADMRPMIQWPDPLPYNDAEEVQSLAQEMQLGILSKETAAGLRGRDWELEQERLANEETAQDTIGSRLLRAFEQGQ